MAGEPEQLGGSLTALMDAADQLLDAWVKHTATSHPNSPELLVMLLATARTVTNFDITAYAMLATALQRLAQKSQ